MFRLFKDLATIMELTYVNNKSTLTATSKSYKWYLKPLKPDDSLYQGAFGKDFSFTTKISVDIKEWDVLSIKSVNYSVKAIAPWEWLTVKYKRLLLVKK